MKNKQPLEQAKTSLLGLSVGDAFGETFFGAETVIRDRIQHRKLQEGTWLFTDTGSIVVLSAGEDSIPLSWIRQTERWDNAPFFK